VSGLKAPFASAPEIVVLTEVATGDETGRGRETLAEALCVLMEDDLAEDALVAQSEADRRRFWAYRESPYVYRERWPSFIGFDVSVPLARMGEAVGAFRAAMARLRPDAVHVVFGHIADSNLHVIVTGEGAHAFDKGAIERAIYGVVASVGGSVSAEHGIGRNKRDFLALSRTEPELALMRTLKRALDPENILNPERVL
jgi:FAD/FMN-containing dehydrogenase